MSIINILRKIKRYLYFKRIEKYADLSKDSIYENAFLMRTDNPFKGRKYLKIGHQCMIGANVVFESTEGFVQIGDRCQLSSGTSLISRTRIIIEDDVIIAGGCLIYDHDSHSIYWDERSNDVIQQIDDYNKFRNPIKNKNWSVVKSQGIVIKSKVWIGNGVTILKGVTIGEGAVIGAKSVVTHDVEPYSLVAGNPAREIKKIRKDY